MPGSAISRDFRMPAATQSRMRCSRKSNTSSTTSLYCGGVVHRLRIALRMHQHDRRARFTATSSARRIVRQRRHVIEDVSTCVRRTPHHFCLARVDRNIELVRFRARSLRSPESRRSSSSSATVSDPGRVDSPPTSNIGALFSQSETMRNGGFQSSCGGRRPKSCPASR